VVQPGRRVPPKRAHPSAYAEQLALCGSEEDFRLNVTFADGGAIPLALAHIREVLRAETIPHRWREGDIVLLDNHLAAHGRRRSRATEDRAGDDLRPRSPAGVIRQ
jgi:alpha-ketoglutarate-dependent taurine dioxygenase